MRDSVPHLALILLLLELASTMNGRLCDEHENIQIFAAPCFFFVLSLDFISNFADKIPMFKKLFGGSLVKDREIDPAQRRFHQRATI